MTRATELARCAGDRYWIIRRSDLDPHPDPHGSPAASLTSLSARDVQLIALRMRARAIVEVVVVETNEAIEVTVSLSGTEDTAQARPVAVHRNTSALPAAAVLRGSVADSLLARFGDQRTLPPPERRPW